MNLFTSSITDIFQGFNGMNFALNPYSLYSGVNMAMPSIFMPSASYFSMPAMPMMPIFGGFNFNTGLFAQSKSTTSKSNSSDTQTTTSATTTQTKNGTSSNSSAISDTKSELKPGLFKGSLKGQEALVTKICKKYNVSPALVASIIGLESGYGTSELAQKNNFMGYRAAGDLGKNAKGFGYFSTAEKGLEAAIKNLSKYTRYSDVSKVDFNNIDAIGRHYCEGGVWSQKVKNVYSTVVKKYTA